MGGYSDEFPLLKAYKLYAADIRGDGNCLFNALSDQIYGHQNDHDTIRARVIDYMREHAEYYKQFIDVYPGGGQRRNPKRKNAGVYSTPASFAPPTTEEIDRVFQSHLNSMARGGTYGDNMEISAFCSAFGVDVKIYQQDFAYMVPAPDTGAVKPVAHIAYHAWEHYSSIRNIDGPHTGLPEVREAVLSPEEDAKNKAAAGQAPRIQPWQVKVVMSSLPYLADHETIKKTLEEFKGNINDAVSALLDAEDRASVSSQNGSSSTERDRDSDDEQFSGPSKKQDRRLSRATKAMQKDKAQKVAKEVVSKGPTIAAKQEPTAVQRPFSPGAALPVRPFRAIAPRPIHQLQQAEGLDEEGWNTSDSEFRFNPQIPDSDAGSEYSVPSSSQPQPEAENTKPTTKPTIKITFTQGPNKTSQKQPGPPKPPRIPARQLKEQKKLAQKAARKERSKTTTQRELAPATANAKNIPPPPLDLGIGIKTLYI